MKTIWNPDSVGLVVSLIEAVDQIIPADGRMLVEGKDQTVAHGIWGIQFENVNNLTRAVAAVMKSMDEAPLDKGGFRISVSLAAKLAAAVVHGDELTGPRGHVFDVKALRTVVEDLEVVAWIKELGPLAPVKR